MITEAINNAFSAIGGAELNSVTLDALLAKYNPLAIQAIAPSRKSA